MSLNKTQFQTLVYEIVQKIKSTEGAISYIYDTPGCFDNTRGKGHIYYQATSKLLIDLDKLSDDGEMILCNEYHMFIDQLIVDTENLIKAVKLQRQPFLDYLEKIENL